MPIEPLLDFLTASPLRLSYPLLLSISSTYLLERQCDSLFSTVHWRQIFVKITETNPNPVPIKP